ncbi:hydroxyisourate hydrolase [Hoeflea sp. TYP-13]|uniref:hydroxyisourate hydrolase n=1 Tax=Hoeflea sp. TYP-13 TaxID=3230023 RepID=UPI0034C6A365
MTATISTHVLNGVDGSHCGGIEVTLSRLNSDGSRETWFTQSTGADGRLVREIELSWADPQTVYEMTFRTGPYWAERELPRDGPQLVSEIVIRVQMQDPDKRYHIPIIISPNSYSVWWSS